MHENLYSNPPGNPKITPLTTPGKHPGDALAPQTEHFRCVRKISTLCYALKSFAFVNFQRIFAGHCYVDVVFVIDSTASIQDANWESVMQMLRLMVAAIDSNSTLSATSRVAVITYSNRAIIEVNLEQNWNKAAILNEIDTGIVYHRGSDNDMRTAVKLAQDVLANNTRTVNNGINATQAVIVFTDGKQTVRAPGMILTDAEWGQLIADTNNDLQATLYGLMDKRVYVTMIGKLLRSLISETMTINIP